MNIQPPAINNDLISILSFKPSYILSTYIAGKAVLHKEFRITSLGVFKFFSCYLATNKGISILFLDEYDIIAIQLYKERTEAIEKDKFGP